MSDPQNGEQEKFELDKRRSAVRIRVTYSVIGAYIVLAATVIVWLMWAGRYEVAIGVHRWCSRLGGFNCGLLVRFKTIR